MENIGKAVNKPESINFSMVTSDKPSIFMAFLLTKSSKALSALPYMQDFQQYRHVTSSLVTSFVGPPQTGQTDGIVKLLLCVRFSAI